jgi:hypothetical protein
VLYTQGVCEPARQVKLRGQVRLVVRGDGEDPLAGERSRRDREGDATSALPYGATTASSSLSRSSTLSIAHPFEASEPPKDLLRALIRREDRVEDLLDPAIVDDQRQPLQQDHAIDLERR